MGIIDFAAAAITCGSPPPLAATSPRPLHQLRPVRRPLPYQHHHDHRRHAPLGRAGLHAVPRLPAPLPRERHPVRCEDRASRPLRQPRPRESSQARITLLPSLVQAIP